MNASSTGPGPHARNQSPVVDGFDGTREQPHELSTFFIIGLSINVVVLLLFGAWAVKEWKKNKEKNLRIRQVKKDFPIGTVTLFGTLVCLVIVISVAVNRLIPETPKELAGVLRPAPRALQPIAFKDHRGRLYTLAELEGRWTFLFFGYTYCPDICPTTLTMLTLLVKRLEQENNLAEDIQVLFVSVDPHRDNPEVLAQYLAYFNDEFVGITADETKTRAFADQFGAMFFKEQEMDTDNYLMAHASSIYLVGPNAEIIASFSPPHDSETIASQFRTIRGL